MSYKQACQRNRESLVRSLSLLPDEDFAELLARARSVIRKISTDWDNAFCDHYGLHEFDRPIFGKFPEKTRVYYVYRAGRILDEVLESARRERRRQPSAYRDWPALSFFTHERAFACDVTHRVIAAIRSDLEQRDYAITVGEYADQTEGELIRRERFTPIKVEAMRKMMRAAGVRLI